MKKNILIFPRTMGLGGTENVVLQLCEILKSQKYKIVVCSCGGVNVNKLEQMGIKHYLIPDIQQKSPKVIYEVLRTLVKIIKTENITIVHTQHRMAAFYVRLLLYKYKFTFINTAHNTFYNKKLLTRFAYKHTHIIAVGEHVKKNLTEFYDLPDDQVTVIHNAIKPFNGQIHPVTELVEARKKGYTLIGNIGRLTEQKGMEYFIEAAAEVLKDYPKARFFIIGDGEDSEKLRKMVLQLLPEGVLKFMGYRSDIQNVMSQLDFVVLSSLWEGLPLTPIEAFSVGKTVVATAVDGTPEIVENEKNGLLVSSRNTEELKTAMLRLCIDMNLRSKLEKDAFETYQLKFSFKTMKEQYLSYYEKLWLLYKHVVKS